MNTQLKVYKNTFLVFLMPFALFLAVACCDQSDPGAAITAEGRPCPDSTDATGEESHPANPSAPAEIENIPEKELSDSVPPVEGTSHSTHPWEYISYVPVEGLFGVGSRLFLTARPTKDGLRFRVQASDSKKELFNGAKARLHLPGSRTIEVVTSGLLGIFGNSRGEPPQLWEGIFPWPRKPSFDEAVVELDLGDSGRLWIEIPYGFFSPPRNQLIPDDPRRKGTFPDVMKDLGDRDHIVPFRHITYGSFDLPGGEKATVHASNPFDAHVELALYRQPANVGESSYRWKLHEPRSFVTIVPGHKGRTLEGRPMMTRLHEDGLHRSDHYTFDRSDDTTRTWGKIVVRVGESKIEIPVPSSLYGYTHGSADTHHKRRVVYPNLVLDNWLF